MSTTTPFSNVLRCCSRRRPWVVVVPHGHHRHHTPPPTRTPFDPPHTRAHTHPRPANSKRAQAAQPSAALGRAIVGSLVVSSVSIAGAAATSVAAADEAQARSSSSSNTGPRPSTDRHQPKHTTRTREAAGCFGLIEAAGAAMYHHHAHGPVPGVVQAAPAPQRCVAPP